MAFAGRISAFWLPPLVCIFYDHLLTLEPEVRLVWKASWSPAKSLFLFARYLTLVSAILYYGASWLFPSGRGTSGLMYLSTIGPWTLADLLLALRVCALWKMDPIMIIASAVIFAATSAATIALTVLAFASAITHNEGWPPTSVGPNPIKVFVASRACTLLFDLWACTMTVVQAVRHAKAGQIQSSLLQVFYRDGLLYYATIILIKGLSIVIAYYCYSMTSISISWNDVIRIPCALTVIMTSRMFLSLKDVRTTEDWAYSTNILRGRKNSLIQGSP